MPSFYVYSAADIGLPDTFANWLASPSSTVSGTASPDILNMSDDDLALENEGGGSSQLLTSTLTIDGAVVGTIGNIVVNLGQSAISNATTGDVGQLVVIQIDGVAVGYGSTIPLNPGDSISMTAWAGTPDSIDYDQLEPSCFLRGTRIKTKSGYVAIQHLKIDDHVWTKDNGFQKIRWIGAQTVSGMGRFAPICFKGSAIENRADLIVSPLHRMLIDDWRSDVIFGQKKVLAHARDMVNGTTIIGAPTPWVQYFHLMFDQHQIIDSEGMLSESFNPNCADLDGFNSKTRNELLAIFPELNHERNLWPDIHPTLSTAESMLLQML